MWLLFALSVKNVYCWWPSIVLANSSMMAGAPTLYGLIAITAAGYALNLIVGIAGMFIRPGDKDNDPTTVDYSIEVPPSGAPAHGLREKGYIFPDIANPFTFFYLYKKVVDVVLPDNSLCHQERWMWSWMRGLKNLMATPRSPSESEIAGMKRGGVYSNTDSPEILTAAEVMRLINMALGELDKEWTENLINMHKMHVALKEKVNVMHEGVTDSERAGYPARKQANPDLLAATDALVKVTEAQRKNFAALSEEFKRRQSVVNREAKRVAIEAAKEEVGKLHDQCSCNKGGPAIPPKKTPKAKAKK
jgi:hypothetical protein